MQTGHVDSAADYYAEAGNIRTGARTVKNLLTGTEGARDNYKFAFSYGEEGESWESPRHRHLFEQVRHVIDGEYVIARNKVLPAGWVGYFPESAYYGPQVKSPSLKMVTLQFGGPSGLGFYSVAQRREAMKSLREKGTFSDGIYHRAGDDGGPRNEDAGEAVWREVFGDVVYPGPRYDGIVLIDPSTFAWMKDESSPGVWCKQLGTFSEREIKIALIRLDAGARLVLGAAPSAEVMFLKHGAVSSGGQAHGPLTAFGSAAGDQPDTLVAAEDAELLYVKLPTFGAR
jgi:hypothetical protein